MSFGVAAMVGAAASPACTLTTTLAANSPKEQQTRAQLQRLSSTLALDSWTLTPIVRIEAGSIPHSHPVLTLNTRHLDKDALLLATFIHEQMHWWLDRHAAATRRAKDDLRRLYPSLPVGYPRGANDEDSSYEHLLVIWLEIEGVNALLGEPAGRAVLGYWKGDHYTALYGLVDADRDKIGAIVRRRGLVFTPSGAPRCAN